MLRLQSLLLALLLPALPARAEPSLERLFSSPTERAALDRVRHQRGNPGAGEAALDSASRITLDGYARNSSGRATAWINQGGDDRHALPQLVDGSGPARQPARVTMRPPEGPRIDLKVGQTYDVGTNTIREQYQAAEPDAGAGGAKAGRHEPG